MKVAAVQLAVGSSQSENLERAARLIDSAVEKGAGVILLCEPSCLTSK